MRPHLRGSGVKVQLLTRRVSSRYEKEFDQVQDVFELQVSSPVHVAILRTAL